LHLSLSILEAKSLSLLHSLKIDISNGLHNVMFEMKSKTLVAALQALNVPCNEFSDLVSECKSLLFSNSDYVVSFIIRQTTRVTHSIVRTALSDLNPHLFYDVSPLL